MATEQTQIMIKPDGVQRGLVGQIIQRFEQKGFFLCDEDDAVEKSHAEKHYADLSSKPFFGDLVDYMCSGPVVCMVWEGKEVVKTGRKIIGATNPSVSARPDRICRDNGPFVPVSSCSAAAAFSRRFARAIARRHDFSARFDPTVRVTDTI